MKKALFLILLAAVILRFYNLSGYLQFLGDQGRDVSIVRDMIVYHKWTLLGPNASVGGFFTGPVYYYFMLPFLWLFNLDPAGPAYMAALFGVGTVALIYFFCKKLFNARVGVISALLVTISPMMINISRFSWNPNPVPFFSLLTMLLLYFTATKKQLIYTFFAGISLGILFQLHYMAVVMIPIAVLTLFFTLSLKDFIIHSIAMFLGFLCGDSLFLIFEIRHGFPNTRSVWEFVTRRGQTVAPRSFNFAWLFVEMLRRLYGMLFEFRDTVWEYVFLVASLVGFGIFWVKNQLSKPKVVVVLVWLIIGAIGIGSYQGALHDHYFNYLYPLPFILLGVTFDLLFRSKKTVILALAGLGILGYFCYKSAFFLQPPHNMMQQIQDIDKIILNDAQGQPYNLALISSYNTDYTYRYYLEIWNKAPVVLDNPQNDPGRKTVTPQLMVICEDKICQPLGNPLWEIAGFGQAKIISEKEGPAGIKIFKLVHLSQ